MARRSSVSSGAWPMGSGSGLGPRTANRTVAFPATSSSTHVEAELIRLACADTNSLARRWRVLFGGRAPDLPRALLQRILAYRIQADAAGDLDPTTIKVLDSGFAWNGVTYESLSKVARAITGTNWNGPRFFGLRDRARAS